MRYACALFLLTVSASGCSNIIDTKMMSSKSIFLTPGSTRTIYIQNRNISENQQVTLNDLASKLTAKGYAVLQDPSQVQFLLQTKVLYCNEAKETVSFESVLGGGFGAGVGSTNPGMGGDMGGMGGMPDINAMMAQAMRGMGRPAPPKDDSVLYFCAVDVQVTEQGQGKGGAMPVPTSRPAGQMGQATGNQLRIAAGVKQKKLDLEEATPLIREKLTIGIAGMF